VLALSLKRFVDCDVGIHVIPGAPATEGNDVMGFGPGPDFGHLLGLIDRVDGVGERVPVREMRGRFCALAVRLGPIPAAHGNEVMSMKNAVIGDGLIRFVGPVRVGWQVFGVIIDIYRGVLEGVDRLLDRGGQRGGGAPGGPRDRVNDSLVADGAVEHLSLEINRVERGVGPEAVTQREGHAAPDFPVAIVLGVVELTVSGEAGFGPLGQTISSVCRNETSGSLCSQ